ncbi:hypothetical protein [Clostridium butyricum]|uniref:Uncharacterized protein n=1 Tax=Clostridium butyricum TaxID=1492 RepID=A0A512TLH2_CLOBU|nr:hypothetical protein [Clostridium butyricum]MBS5984071.1 hypothetical protein [Clostridium butyricum]MDB2153723.1 hypothetical protein [Clostridium butyricum]MDK2829505.1 hypothetical protein [Clostridium butyricum]NOW23903.1 hypothetical protein [Clostridium butyricum]GEQ21099.1 hypothetical protein CBU02nite_16050 [Clostridium butyricum]
MEVFLEQFIACDKSRHTLKNIKTAVIAVLVFGVLMFFLISPLIALLMQIAAVIFFLVTYFSFIDYEYELFNGNIDVSKIYAGSRRKVVKKINSEDVEFVYESSNNAISKDALFNKNIKGLKIYTFEFKDRKKVQLALNEELEKIVKIVYRGKMQIR